MSVKPANCANCDAPLSGHYCANCGQEAVLHHASTREFLHEFIGHYVALEGKLWGSLARLLFRPGLLTNEYIRGRRVRFVQPLRLYLTFSLLFFALLKLTGGGLHVPEDAGTAAPSAEVAAPAKTHAGAVKLVQDDKEGDNAEQYVGDQLARWPALRQQWHAFNRLPGEQQVGVFQKGLYSYAPYAVFCLMPVFALFLKVLYLGSGRRFGEHVLFALHTNAFAFFIFGLMLLMPWDAGKMLWLWLIAYLPWAMRRVYHSSRFGTFWRWALLMLSYSLVLGLALAFSSAMGIMSVGH